MMILPVLVFLIASAYFYHLSSMHDEKLNTVCISINLLKAQVKFSKFTFIHRKMVSGSRLHTQPNVGHPKQAGNILTDNDFWQC